MYEWHKTRHPGIRYRKHPTRKRGVDFDRYYVIRYQRDGRTVDERIGWASKVKDAYRVAIARLAEINENIRTGRGPQSLKEARQALKQQREEDAIRSITFNEFWTRTYAPRAKENKMESSWKAEEGWFKNHIEPAIGNIHMADISPLHIERIKRNMAEAGLAPRSVQYCIATVRQVFNTASRLGLFRGDNPAKQVRVKVGDNARVRFLTKGEAGELLDALMRRSLEVHDMALLSLHCGLRAGEIFALTWDCVEFDHGTVFVKDTKSGRNRHAFMTSDVKKMLMRRYMGNDTGLVFEAVGGGKVKMVSATFARTVEAIGLNRGVTDPRQKAVFHTLRHTFASWLVQAGEPLYTVAKLMGHSTMAMSERYSHLAPDNMRGAVERLEESLKQDGKVIKFRR